MSVAFAGSKHVGGTEDIDEAPGRAKARLFDDMTFMGGGSFVSQAKTILTLEPWTVRIRMVPTALETVGGHEVDCVIAGLSRHCHVDAKVLDCWRYNGPTSQRLLIIVSGDRDFVQVNWYRLAAPAVSSWMGSVNVRTLLARVACCDPIISCVVPISSITD